MLRALLDISKLDAGGVVPCTRAIRLRPLLIEIADTLQPLAREKDLEIRIGPGDAVVKTDPGLLHSIIQNLLSNAIRYTRQGGIVVGVRQRGPNARIDVIDSGPGIPPEKSASIFREFERLPDSSEGGIGLGLAIVDRTARLLNARISLNSRIGRGSRFSVSLPRSNNAPVTDGEPVLEGTPLGRTLAVLVVDDDQTNCDALRHYLAPLGHRVTAVNGVTEALAINGSYDVALVDFNLGGTIDGLELIAKLREQGSAARFALITAARPDSYQLRADAMAVKVFAKPLDSILLDRWLAEAPAIISG